MTRLVLWRICRVNHFMGKAMFGIKKTGPVYDPHTGWDTEHYWLHLGHRSYALKLVLVSHRIL